MLASGGIACWGGPYLGNGTTTASSTPVAVSGITNASAIADAQFHTCALLASDSIDCWGANGNGQLGNGTITPESTTPVAVSGITNATAIAAGLHHTCALLTGGSIKCWGYNNVGQLGNGTTTASSTSVTVSGITNAIAIAAGGVKTCALLAGGSIKCWGDNQFGQLGNGTTTGPEYCGSFTSDPCSRTPVAVSGITNAIAIAAGYSHTCARLTGGSINCWGANNQGQLGNGTYADSYAPAPVTGFP